MGKNKKKFIDKKNSSTFHLLHRSQRDVGGDGAQTILWPSPNNLAETNAKVLKSAGPDGNEDTMNRWRDDLNDLVDDYDYDQHMKSITGSGDFIGRDGHRQDAINYQRPLHAFVSTDKDIDEVSRQLDSIALTPECMDDDVAQALFGDFDDGAFEEILDDFCITAAQEPKEELDQSQDTPFDYDEHIRQLMEKARLKKEEKGIDARDHHWGRRDQDLFSRSRPLHQRSDQNFGKDNDDDDDDNSGNFDDNLVEQNIRPLTKELSLDEEKALCEKFQQTLIEYDSDEVGELENECQYIGGELELEGEKQVEALLDDYLEEKKDHRFVEGTRHLPRFQNKSGFHTLEMKHDGGQETIAEILTTAKATLATPPSDLPPEEILIDGQSYFSQKSRNPWDCESILSTYSNLDNNPAIVSNSTRSRKKKKEKKKTAFELSEGPLEEYPSASQHQIKLSDKTGLPLGVLPDHFPRGDGFETLCSVNKGEKRNKEESQIEKKFRKQQIKHERQVARMQKKMMKGAFRDEFAKRQAEATADDVGGKVVFRL